MNKVLTLLFSICLLIAASSCKDDPCDDIDCGTYGTCSGTDCRCDSGYEEDNDGKCNTEIRSKYLGTWVGTHETNGTVSGSYSMTIGTSTDINSLRISNLMNRSCSVGGPLESVVELKNNSATFTSTCTGVTVENSGTAGPAGMEFVDTNTLRFGIIINDTQGQLVYSGIYIRQ